eukprot:scaffold60602_cov35-Tisochrysis_lutea.AAC.1
MEFVDGFVVGLRAQTDQVVLRSFESSSSLHVDHVVNVALVFRGTVLAHRSIEESSRGQEKKAL